RQDATGLVRSSHASCSLYFTDRWSPSLSSFFFFNETATTDIYTLSLHDALPIYRHTGGITYGGYPTSIVVDHDFVLRISDKLDLAATAPLLCAGITTYSPLRHWKVSKGQKVGVVGLGGLGHMAVKLANAFGAEVVLFTTSPGKTADAKRLGAQ